jgi:multidrug efflux pump subunit AcrA (membrane-fusion protein)
MSNEIPVTAKLNKSGSFRFRRLTQKWPLLVWLGMLAFLVAVYMQRGTYGRVNAMVAATIEDIAPPEDGVLLIVHVREGDAVTKGQTLATLDTTLIQKEIDDYKANLPIAKIELQRKFAAARTSAHAALLSTKTDLAQAKARFGLAERTVLAVQDRLDRKLALEAELLAAKSDRDALQAEVTALDEEIVGLSADLTEARARSEEFNKLEIPGELLTLNQRLADKTLLATRSGTVQRIHKLRGIAQLGDPVLSILVTESENGQPAKTVRGFVPQKEHPEDLRAGDTVWVSERTSSPVAFPTTIVSVAPDLAALPNYGTPVPSQFIRGREFICELPADLAHLLPGTGLHIHRKEPGRLNIWSFGKNPVKSAGN